MTDASVNIPDTTRFHGAYHAGKLTVTVCLLCDRCTGWVGLSLNQLMLLKSQIITSSSKNQWVCVILVVVVDCSCSNSWPLLTIVTCISVYQGKTLPYLLPCIGLGADPGVQAVSSSATWKSIPASIKNCSSLYSFQVPLKVSSHSPAH